MFGKLLDKLIFGLTLIVALQVPQLADHYQQFLSGLYESTKWQVEGYQKTAKLHEYDDVNAMISHHLKNDVKSVRTDAEQKLATLQTYDQLKVGMEVFEQGNIVEKTFYMFQPKRYQYLEKTISNFTLGVPITIQGIAFGVIFGLLLNLIITLPFSLLTRKKKPIN